MFVRLTDYFHVAPQITLADMAAAKAEGIVQLINNRPDGEAPGQPTSAEVEAAARAAGLDYLYIPVTGGQFTPMQVAQMQEALENQKATLAFCRTGTRSTLLWALAEAANGADYEKTAATAAKGGYDIAPIAPLFQAVAAQR